MQQSLLQLSQNKPVSIISGTPVDLKEKLRQCNRKEFHHLMPKAFLKDSNQMDLYSENCLANFCFISRTDNRKLGGGSPGVYKNEILGDIDNILKSHICPNVLFDDDYKLFVEKRAKLLVENAKKLCNIQ
ncbi:hypothetical protein ACMHYC_18500 [Acinetobacter courvalinii]|uniref:hypothetical protein n=1 Tax=Acinetobacter courvalinii TaxID=280147 RepID=UPI0039C8D902